MISSPCHGTSDTESFCIKWQTGKKDNLLNSLKATAQTDLLCMVSKQSDKQISSGLRRPLLIGIVKIIYLLVAWTLLQDLCKSKSNTGQEPYFDAVSLPHKHASKNRLNTKYNVTRVCILLRFSFFFFFYWGFMIVIRGRKTGHWGTSRNDIGEKKKSNTRRQNKSYNAVCFFRFWKYTHMLRLASPKHSNAAYVTL